MLQLSVKVKTVTIQMEKTFCLQRMEKHRRQKLCKIFLKANVYFRTRKLPNLKNLLERLNRRKEMTKKCQRP